jgi:hypothetical protein
VVFRWFPEVQNIFYQGNKRKQVPSNHDQDKLESFFNCAATEMTEQLQNLALHSIKDYTDLLVQPEVSTPIRDSETIFTFFLSDRLQPELTSILVSS